MHQKLYYKQAAFAMGTAQKSSIQFNATQTKVAESFYRQKQIFSILSLITSMK